MKLASVLSQYLLSHKQLDVPGLGSFYAETTGDPENATINFEQKKISQFDEAVVDYVASETGKMKSLAISDLSSQLDDVMQFLNSGKPYLIAGIGTLLKKHDGTVSFISNTASAISSKKEAPFTERNVVPPSYIEEQAPVTKSKKPAIIIFILIALAIAATIWFYSKTSKKETAEKEENPQTSPAVKDSMVPSGAQPANAAARSTGVVTYVLETAKEARANKRYNQLKKINWPVELEKIDSLQYSIIMKLPVAASDTSRVKDSLSTISGRRVTIRP